jgi:hypothetical protein
MKNAPDGAPTNPAARLVQIALRLPRRVLDLIDRHAQKLRGFARRPVSRSDAIRNLIVTGLEAQGSTDLGGTP